MVNYAMIMVQPLNRRIDSAVASFLSHCCINFVICGPNLHRASGAQGELPSVGCEVMASQLDLPTLTPMSLAGSGQLQLGAPHWATSVALKQ